MKHRIKSSYKLLYGLNAVLIGLISVLSVFTINRPAQSYADEDPVSLISNTNFVTVHDQDKALTIKTDARTVAEALERAGYTVDASDTVEPGLDEMITANNFHINIYRARPVTIVDGNIKKNIMTASYDPKTIAANAGMAIYDGDEIELVPTTNFLESGVSSTYRITRNGGRTVTEEITIPFEEVTVQDYSMATGETKVTQMGEDGVKVVQYEVNFLDGVEVSRELVSEEIVKAPVNRITAVGAKKSVPPEWATCASWAREAGVSDDDIYAALSLIYRESGCRVDSTNASSGAYGIPQALPGSKMASAGSDWQTNPVTQIKWMAGYVKGRYGGWQQAWAYWQTYHWY